jgi:hypothetical protein
MRARWAAWIAPAALLLAALSLGLNLYLLAQLRTPERWALPAAIRVLESVLEPDGSFRYTVRIPAGTPIELDVPVDERVQIRVDTVIPLRTRVRVPVRTPAGTYSATIPIVADIPVRTVLPLHFRHTFRLRTHTPRDLEVPVEIRAPRLP